MDFIPDLDLFIALKKYKGKYRISSTRLKNWDYGSPGNYLIGLVTKNRRHYLGEIMADPEYPDKAYLYPSAVGIIAQKFWLEIPKHFPFVELDEFIFMPDHMHGILKLRDQGKTTWEPNKFGPQSKNLASVIRGFKAAVKSQCTKEGIEFHWQTRYYDHIIRTQRRLDILRKYIRNNPINWARKKNAARDAKYCVASAINSSL